jgi:hypothetical protein
MCLIDAKVVRGRTSSPASYSLSGGNQQLSKASSRLLIAVLALASGAAMARADIITVQLGSAQLNLGPNPFDQITENGAVLSIPNLVLGTPQTLNFYTALFSAGCNTSAAACNTTFLPNLTASLIGSDSSAGFVGSDNSKTFLQPYSDVSGGTGAHIFTPLAGLPITLSLSPGGRTLTITPLAGTAVTVAAGQTGQEIVQATFLLGPVAVPEPSTFLLLGSSLFAVSLFGLRRKSNS